MKVVGVIPARYGATRFPGKSLYPLAGKPLILWVWEGARRARALDELWVATDDERIATVVRDAGGTVILTRKDHPSGTDRCAEAISGRAADVVINIQGDEPLIDPAIINRLARAMKEDWDMATVAEPLDNEMAYRDPNVVKVVWGNTGRALYFSRHPIPFVRDEDGGFRPGTHWRHVGLYAYRRSFLERLVREPPCALEEAEKLEQLRALHIGARIVVLQTPSAGGRGVDTPEDVAPAEAALRAAGLVSL